MPLFKKSMSKEQKKLLQDKLRIAAEKPDSIFDLSECGIHQVPEGVYSKCKVLQKQALLLQRNELEDIKHGGDIHYLSELMILDLSFNHIARLPKTIKSLVHLQKLDLSHNRLKKLPDEIGGLVGLQVLNVSNNELSGLPPTIKHLKELQSLDITANKFLTNLPVNLCYLSNLVNFTFDFEKVTYPSKEVTKVGIKEIQRWFKKVKGDEFFHENNDNTDGNKISSPPLSPMSSGSSQSEDFENHILAREHQKNLMQKERLRLEQEILDSQTANAKLLAQSQLDRQEVLTQIEKNKQENQIAIAIQFGNDNRERKKLLEQLYLEENHLEETVGLVLQMSERARHTDQLLEEIEQEQTRIDALVQVTQEESDRLRKQEMIDAMNYVLNELATSKRKFDAYEAKKEETIQKSLKSAEIDQEGLEHVLQQKDRQQKALIQDIATKEEKQKEAFLLLQFQQDAKLNRIKKQVDMIEAELARLSALEMEKRKERNDQEINSLAEMRVQTAMVLSQLINQQEERETRLKQTIQQMDQRREDDTQDYWLIQFQRLLDNKPQMLVDAENRLDMFVVEILLNAHAKQFLPHFARHKIDEQKMMSLTKQRLIEIGVKDDNVQDEILAAIKVASIHKDKLTKQDDKFKLDSIEGEVSLPAASCPQLERMTSSTVSFNLESECVVCLDRKPDVVLLTCGHVCTCAICCESLSECPLCRQTIIQKCRLFGV